MADISPTRRSRRGTARRARIPNSPLFEDKENDVIRPQDENDVAVLRKLSPSSPSWPSENSMHTAFQSKGDEYKLSGTDVNDVGESSHPSESRLSLGSVEKTQSLKSSSETPDFSQNAKLAEPLSDITTGTINEQNKSARQVQSIDVQDHGQNTEKPERPVDIVIRTRAKAIPTNNESSTPTQRTVITYLILTNFKSYAGRQTVGPFHSSFSSVVGPNGSGKSNVIDSLLFVFGFRASKMRQGKVSALIHNSAAFPDLEFCEVEVHFQEVIDQLHGSTEPVPNSALVISRRAFKNNSSKYYINGRESNFTAVTTLLRERGVDLDHKRFLILQGEVESIAQMKPKAANEHDDGLLEYLEDIIGTSKYKTPIEESAAETESQNDVCAEKLVRVQHVEKEKKLLEGKKDAVLAFIKDENELAMKQSALYQKYVCECTDNVAVTNEAMNAVQNELETEIERHKGREDGLKSLERQYETELKQFERLEQETQTVFKQRAKLDKDMVKFEEKRKHLNTKAKKLEKSIATSQSGVSECTTSISNLEDDGVRNAKTVTDLEGKLRQEEEQLENIRESLKGKTQGLSDEISQKQKDLEPWNARVNEKKSAIAVAQSELAILKEREQASEQATMGAKNKLANLQEELTEKNANLESSRSRREDIVEQISKLDKDLAAIHKKAPVTQSKLASARQRVDEAKASYSKSQTQGNVLTGLMRLKESGRIEGFHGRLGNLGTIEPKYDVAISTACPALDNLVVDSVEVGQKCIEYLRKNNLGRANFILLDRLGKRDMTSPTTPGSAPRLFDLVKPKDERFAPAFFSVLQNTLVAGTLEEAKQLAYGAQRWRVVTLDGQLIDKSGTMSGGGSKVARGLMSSKLTANVTKEQIVKLDGEVLPLEDEWNEMQQKEQQLAETRLEVKKESQNIENQLQRILLEIQSLEKTLKDAEKHLNELTQTKQPRKVEAGQIKALESKVSQYENDVESFQAEMAGTEEAIRVLQEKIMEIGGVKLRSQKAKVDGLKEQIDTISEENAAATVSKTRSEQALKKHEKVQKEARVELESVGEELRLLDADAAAQARNNSGTKKQAEEIEEMLSSKKEELSTLKSELETRSSDLNKSRAVEIEIKNQLEEHQKILGDNQKRLKYWEDKLSKLQLQNVSDVDFGEVVPEQAELNLPTFSRDELSDFDKDVLKGEIAILEEKLQNVNVEIGVLEEYRKRVEEHKSRSDDLAIAVDNRDSAKKRCEELRRLRLEGFMEGFSAISLRLKEMYQMITMGGNAELELVDSLDPFSEGILFSVMPPKKSWKNISNLSGGEKTLSSLALVFALHHYKPTPLYVMDEIDAALDFRNVSIVASYIKERTRNAQFIVISLRNNMFELAARLVGVYKVNHMTKSVTVENRDYIVR